MTSIHDARTRLGLTQQQLAEKLGVTRTTVTMWETGANTPPTKILPKLAEVLQITIDQLFT
jgi:transcriptional regulator with XRE-family HTH domain